MASAPSPCKSKSRHWSLFLFGSVEKIMPNMRIGGQLFCRKVHKISLSSISDDRINWWNRYSRCLYAKLNFHFYSLSKACHFSVGQLLHRGTRTALQVELKMEKRISKFVSSAGLSTKIKNYKRIPHWIHRTEDWRGHKQDVKDCIVSLSLISFFPALLLQQLLFSFSRCLIGKVVK